MSAECCRHDHHSQAKVPEQSTPASGMDIAQATAIHIKEMDCPNEESLIRKALSGQPGIQNLHFDLLNRVLYLQHSEEVLPAVLASIRQLGFNPELQRAATGAAATPAKPWWPLALALLAAVAAEALAFAQLGSNIWQLGLAMLAIGLTGLTTYRKGWLALRHLDFNINALMSIAVSGAILIGEWPEAAMVMALFALAERIEAASFDRARQAVQALLKLVPEQALVQQDDGGWHTQLASEVALGARVRVRPGERVALDGVVRKGHSSLDQAPITGESLPVDKAPGDALYAGSINQQQELEYEVTAVAKDSTLARIIHAIEQAQSRRAPTQQWVDRFARIYTPAVLLLALLIALLPPLLGWGEWLEWLYRALVLLVIACPCALVISTPITLVSALARGARLGILIKGGIYLEQGRHLHSIALDKTGTLTAGKPSMTDAVWLAEALSQQHLTALTLALASRSDHPLAQALYRDLQPQAPYALAEVEGFCVIQGQGVTGLIDGQRYWLGNPALMAQQATLTPGVQQQLLRWQQQGQSTVSLAGPQGVLACYALSDQLKAGSRAAIAELQQLGLRTLMLSGDNHQSAASIAAQVGIDEVAAELLPEQKAEQIRQRVAQGQRLAMVGDGINDAPALASAQVGIAMGALGTDVAIETADVALMDDDLRKLPQFIRLCRRTWQILLQNIILALGLKLAILLLTLAGGGSLWLAVFADMGTSLLVVANSLRLLHMRL